MSINFFCLKNYHEFTLRIVFVLMVALISVFLHEFRWSQFPVLVEGDVFEADLTHLHSAFLIVITILFRDRIALFTACVFLSIARYISNPDDQRFISDAITYCFITFLLIEVCSRLALWRRVVNEMPKLREFATAFFVLIFVFPVLSMFLTNIFNGCYELSVYSCFLDIDSQLPLFTFCAKFFGALIISLPMLLIFYFDAPGKGVSKYHSYYLMVTVVFFGVIFPISIMYILESILDEGFLEYVFNIILDVRILLVAMVVVLVFFLKPKWVLISLIFFQIFIVDILTSFLNGEDGSLNFSNILLIGLEIAVIQFLVIFVLLYESKSKIEEHNLHVISRTDPLTGLPNLNALKDELKTCEPAAGVGVLLLDQLTDVIASLGVNQLADFYRQLSNALSGKAQLFVISGARCALLLKDGVASWEDALKAVLSFEFAHSRGIVRCIPYLGVATKVKFSETAESILVRASQAAICAREKAELTPYYYDLKVGGASTDFSIESINHEADALAAVRNGAIELYFQPIVSLDGSDERISGEILCRLRDKDGRLLMPGQFISALQRTGRLIELDIEVLKAVSSYFSQAKHLISRIGKISINVSGQSLCSKAFKEILLAEIINSPLSKSQICIEITETDAIQDVAAAELISSIKKMGCLVSLDDFGIGYQSLERLLQFKFDIVKIDGFFVKNMGCSKVSEELVNSVATAVIAVGAESCAEFIQDLDTVEKLRSAGVKWGQGAYFGLAKPISDYLTVDS